MSRHFSAFRRFQRISAAAILAMCCWPAPGQKWNKPQTTPRPAALPRLKAELKRDGIINEWRGAACIPVLSEACIATRGMPEFAQTWQGPADASMLVFCAWTPQGLALAAEVADSELLENDRADGLLWQRDSIEIFVDGRVGTAFMAPSYGPGAYQIFLRPPGPERGAHIAVREDHGRIPGLQAAGLLAGRGYTVEALIPWSAFPNFKPEPGAAIAFQVALDDFDPGDDPARNAMMLNWQATKQLSNSPKNFIPWRLVESFEPGPEANAAPAVCVNVNGVVAGPASAHISLDVAPLAAAATPAAGARVAVFDSSGGLVFESKGPLAAAAAPWTNAAARFDCEWTPAPAAEGYFLVQATLLDEKGAALGKTEKTALLINAALDGLRAGTAELLTRAKAVWPKLAGIDIAAAAKQEPFRAAAACGAAAAYEKLKRFLLAGEPAGAPAALIELERRLEILALPPPALPRVGAETLPPNPLEALVAGAAIEKFRVHLESLSPEQAEAAFMAMEKSLAFLDLPPQQQDEQGMFDLLRLAGMPDAQVAVEYPNYGQQPTQTADLLFFWGPLPMLGIYVRNFAAEADAANSLAAEKQWLPLQPLAEPAKIAGFPAAIARRSYSWSAMQPQELNPDSTLLLSAAKNALFLIVNADMLPMARPKAVLAGADCPPELHAAVLDLARSNALPLLKSAEEIGQYESALISGRANILALAGQNRRLFRIAVKDAPAELAAAAGKRVFSCTSVSAEAAEKALALALAGRPIAPEDTRALRDMLATAIGAAPKPAEQQPPSRSLFCGDVHSHSFYSDGTPSPAGLALQALYTFMDFLVLSDHNTIEGAAMGQKLLRDAGFEFALITGEEITCDWAHLNAYPLRERIAPELPLAEMAAAAHAQGAVIQWNHPPYPASDWAMRQSPQGLEGTGLDAWEHIPDAYEEWKASGRLPQLVGSSDTHSGTFGGGGRTVIFAETAAGEAIAAAIREKRAAAVYTSEATDIFFGADEILTRCRSALAHGELLREQTCERLKRRFNSARLADLLSASQK